MNKQLLSFITAGLLFFSISGNSASAQRQPAGGEIYTLVLPNDEGHEFELTKYVNEHGELELRVAHREIRRMLPDTQSVILWGRDLTGDGLMDAWFYYGPNGTIESAEMESKREDGWDAAAGMLMDPRVDFANRWFLGIVLDEISGAVTLSRSRAQDFNADLTRRQLDLRDLEIRANRLFKIRPDAPGLTRAFTVVSDGWAKISEDANSQLWGDWKNFTLKKPWQICTGTKGLLFDGICDSSLYLGGEGLLKALSKGFSWMSARIMTSETVASLYERYVAEIAKKAEAAARRMRARIRLTGQVATKSTGAVAVKFAELSTHQQVQLSLRAMDAGVKAGRAVAKAGVQGTKSLVRAGIDRRDYILLSQTMQIGIEAWNRRKDFFSGDPIVISRSRSEMAQNVTFMTIETFLLASVSNLMNGSSFPKKVLIGGLIALGDSTFMNFVVMGKTDTSRVALDSSWEAVVGNFQVQLDGVAENYAQNLAKNGNPKLKLLGSAFVIADQSVGYLGYGKLTQAYESGALGQYLAKVKKRLTVTSSTDSSEGENSISFVNVAAPIY